MVAARTCWRATRLAVLAAVAGTLVAAATVALMIGWPAVRLWMNPVRAGWTGAHRADGGERAEVVFVTATSENHFCVLLLLLESIFAHEGRDTVPPPAPVVVYDLGMTAAQAAWLRGTAGVELRTFLFEAYPPHFAMPSRSFAWKPVVLEALLDREADVVVWLDAGDRLMRPIRPLLPAIRASSGFVSRPSGGTVRDWTHPGTLAALGVAPPDDAALLRRDNCDASLVVLVRNKTLDTLVRPWRACALNATCITPPGSSIANHRQDQAVLSVLVNQRTASHGFTCTSDDPVDRDVSDAVGSHSEDRPFGCRWWQNSLPHSLIWLAILKLGEWVGSSAVIDSL